MHRIALFTLMTLGPPLAGAACSSSESGDAADAGGGTASAGGAAGGVGGVGGAGGGAVDADAFMPLAPCNTVDDYTIAASDPSGITFDNTLTYAPKCLKILPGWSLVFTGNATNFGVHPLFPSSRGDAADNPITQVLSGTTSPVFTFTKPGYYGYYCAEHGTDSGSGMAGVVWVGDE
jgi:plastocyanin